MITARRFLLVVLPLAFATVAGVAWMAAEWLQKCPLNPSGGLFIPGEILVSVPQFFQSDPRWGKAHLGPSDDTIASAGCAVSSAAMVLASYGIDTDPGHLNAFLAELDGGYTPQGWIYWEKAAEIAPTMTAKLLPHYEDQPSYFLIDWNLLNGNPVIVRLRYPGGTTHFVVICGKRGYDYLVRDPGSGGEKGIYPLREFGSSVEALRFYRKPS